MNFSFPERVMVLGSASWLGFLLLNKLNIFKRGIKLAGTIHHQQVNFDFNVKLYRADLIEEYLRCLNEFQPLVIVNLLKADGAAALNLHRRIIDYCRLNNCYYMFASSALALDACRETDLTEDVLANAESPYGQFKARCEYDLYDFVGRWSIIRFASVQGWVPHKVTRNERLLQKVKIGQKILVDRGVIQNRMIADLMVDCIVRLIEQQVQGIIHLGTFDSSEEFEFLGRQAEMFGYSPSLIESGPMRNVNLFTIPKKIYDLFGEEYFFSEQDTLQGLVNMPGLVKYRVNYQKC